MERRAGLLGATSVILLPFKPTVDSSVVQLIPYSSQTYSLLLSLSAVSSGATLWYLTNR